MLRKKNIAAAILGAVFWTTAAVSSAAEVTATYLIDLGSSAPQSQTTQPDALGRTWNNGVFPLQRPADGLPLVSPGYILANNLVATDGTPSTYNFALEAYTGTVPTEAGATFFNGPSDTQYGYPDSATADGIYIAGGSGTGIFRLRALPLNMSYNIKVFGSAGDARSADFTVLNQSPARPRQVYGLNLVINGNPPSPPQAQLTFQDVVPDSQGQIFLQFKQNSGVGAGQTNAWNVLEIQAVKQTVETVAYWRLENGAFLTDSSGNGNSLIQQSTSTATQVALPATGRGSKFKPIPLTGAANNSAADFTRNTANNPLRTTNPLSKAIEGDFTVEVMAHVDSAQSNNGLVMNSSNPSAIKDGFSFSLNAAGNLSLFVGTRYITGENYYGSATSSAALSAAPGSDYYLAAEHNELENSVTFFMKNLTTGGPLLTETITQTFVGNLNQQDFTMDASVADINNPSVGTPVVIGSLRNIPTGIFDPPQENQFDGLIDEVRLSLGKVPANQLLVASLAPNLPGDYNSNGVVDAADYVTWKKNVGMAAGTLPNDTDGGTIGSAQYTTWRSHFGNPFPGLGSSTQVPEPSAILLVILGLSPMLVRRSRA